MTFQDAVRTCFVKYADFNGCASVSEFWWWVLFVFGGNVVLLTISWTLYTAFAMATLLPYIAVATRRLHDTDRSGWLQLLGFIPIAGWIVLIIWFVQEGKSSSRYVVQ